MMTVLKKPLDNCFLAVCQVKEGRKEGRKDGRKEGRKEGNLLFGKVYIHQFFNSIQ